jgi:hypothetical protein
MALSDAPGTDAVGLVIQTYGADGVLDNPVSAQLLAAPWEAG